MLRSLITSARGSFAALAVLITFSLPALGASLPRARTLMTQLNFTEAIKELRALESDASLTVSEYLEVLELEAVAAGTTKQKALAKELFQKMLSIDSKRTLSGSHPPRVMTPFYEATSWVKEAGAIELARGPARIEKGAVQEVRATFANNALKLVTSVNFHLKVDDGPWKETKLAPESTLVVPTKGVKVQWWVAAVDALGRPLKQLGSIVEPLVDEVPSVAPVKSTPTVSLVPTTPPSEPITTVTAPATSRITPLRILSLTFGGLAVGSAVTGVVLGIQSANGRATFNSTPVDARGVIEGYSRADALALNSYVQTTALIANICFAVAGGLLAGGVVTWFAGAPTP